MTIANIMLTIIAVSQLIFALALVILFKKIIELLTATHRSLADLSPKVGRLIDETSGRVNDLKGVTENASAVSEDIRAITGRVREGVEFVQVIKRPAALWAGVKAGLAVLTGNSGTRATTDMKTDGKGDQHE